MKLGHKELWSSLAATIMVQIGPRGTARRLFENSKNSQKSQFECQNSGPSFFASVSPVCCKIILTRFEQNWQRRYILKFAPMAIPAMALLQQHDARRDILIEPAPRWSAAIEAWGHSKLGAQSGHKNLPACPVWSCALSSLQWFDAVAWQEWYLPWRKQFDLVPWASLVDPFHLGKIPENKASWIKTICCCT